MGPEVGCGEADCAPGCDCDRFMEYWNLVFPQYDMDEHGRLRPMKPSIDTGMGLERIAAIIQGAPTVFESDAFDYLIAAGEKLSGARYGSSEQVTRALRAMADHARAVAFLIMDGVLPGNEGRDYVLRRIIRRAVRKGWPSACGPFWHASAACRGPWARFPAPDAHRAIEEGRT